VGVRSRSAALRRDARRSPCRERQNSPEEGPCRPAPPAGFALAPAQRKRWRRALPHRGRRQSGRGGRCRRDIALCCEVRSWLPSFNVMPSDPIPRINIPRITMGQPIDVQLRSRVCERTLVLSAWRRKGERVSSVDWGTRSDLSVANMLSEGSKMRWL
jgi:hypothetical protein